MISTTTFRGKLAVNFAPSIAVGNSTNIFDSGDKVFPI